MPSIQPVAQSPFLRSHQADPLTLPPPSRMPKSLLGDGQAYPAGVGRRVLARVVDWLLPLAAAAGLAWMLLGDARDHIGDKIDAVEQAGVTQQVALVDGTTGVYVAMVLGVFLGVGLLVEALPVAIWGVSPGKALCRARVLDVARQEPPSFGAALLRWLVVTVLCLLVVGAVGVLWAVRDRPWRQGWHDKAAGTFVAGGGAS